jgi:hypothetical protein
VVARPGRIRIWDVHRLGRSPHFQGREALGPVGGFDQDESVSKCHMAAKLSAIFSQRMAMRLNHFSLPMACSMRARRRQGGFGKKLGLFLVFDRYGITGRIPTIPSFHPRRTSPNSPQLTRISVKLKPAVGRIHDRYGIELHNSGYALRLG